MGNERQGLAKGALPLETLGTPTKPVNMYAFPTMPLHTKLFHIVSATVGSVEFEMIGAPLLHLSGGSVLNDSRPESNAKGSRLMCESQIAVKYESKSLRSRLQLSKNVCGCLYCLWVRFGVLSCSWIVLLQKFQPHQPAREAQTLGGRKIVMLPLNLATGIIVWRLVEGIDSKWTSLVGDDAMSTRSIIIDADQ